MVSAENPLARRISDLAQFASLQVPSSRAIRSSSGVAAAGRASAASAASARTAIQDLTFMVARRSEHGGLDLRGHLVHAGVGDRLVARHELAVEAAHHVAVAGGMLDMPAEAGEGEAGHLLPLFPYPTLFR